MVGATAVALSSWRASLWRSVGGFVRGRLGVDPGPGRATNAPLSQRRRFGRAGQRVALLNRRFSGWIKHCASAAWIRLRAIVVYLTRTMRRFERRRMRRVLSSGRQTSGR